MLSTVRTYASFVKLSHTVFALPFAIAGMVAAYAMPWTRVFNAPQPVGWSGAWHNPQTIWFSFSWLTLALVLCCMLGARSFAMALNRIVDSKIDALNPRTATREIPAGRLTLRQAWLFATASAALYFGSCAFMGQVVLALSPIPIGLMALYPYTKRFTALCHLLLGASLGLAPVGAWVAVRSMMAEYLEHPVGSWLHWRATTFREQDLFSGLGWDAVAEPAPWLLGGAVMFWVAGFDVIYALQDDEFDRANKLHSVPAALGRVNALWVARVFHAASAGLMFLFVYAMTQTFLAPLGTYGVLSQLVPWVWAAPCVMLAGMIYQHSLVKPDDLSRVNVAFFTVNGIISVVFGAIFVAAWLLA